MAQSRTGSQANRPGEGGGHFSRGESFATFGRTFVRPAPLQVSWLDYFHSTGTMAIDMLISDAVSSPKALSSQYTELVVHLPSGRLCYTPPEAPVPRPRIDGPIRFGSFNRVSKINDAVLACWARVLAGVR